MRLDQLAFKLYDTDCSHKNRETAEWEHLPEDVRDYWRGQAMCAANALGVKIEPAMDTRYLAALIVLDGIDAKLGRDGLNEGIARAIVAALDAKRA
jgi:hypothetical protein